MKITLIGNGYLGQAYARMFPDAYIYDGPKGIGTIELANQADLAIVAVPTDPLPDGELDMAIVRDVVGWLETPLILIKSALMPGTVDQLVKDTGKRIAVSVEYIGLGNYYIDPHDYPDAKDPRKHKLLVVGGETTTAQACAEILWSKMSPDIRIHLVSATEAEIVKLIENFYGALKVTFANCLYNLSEAAQQSFLRIHQAWSADGRVDPMHTRVVAHKRGWSSHCYDKDVAALGSYAATLGANDMQSLVSKVIELNQQHVGLNG